MNQPNPINSTTSSSSSEKMTSPSPSPSPSPPVLILQNRILRPNQTRVRDLDGFIGTVRYVGPVASAKEDKEVYVGIEWDDPSRGKHDGSVICRKTHRIVRHFTCQNQDILSPTMSLSSSLSSFSPSLATGGGSFVRPKMIDMGVDFTVELIRSRYVSLEDPLVAPDGILDVAKTKSGRDKNIELVGEMNIRKRQQLCNLSSVSFRNMGISQMTPSSCNRQSIRDEFQHQVLDMDFAGNLISDWGFVFDLLRMFPVLNSVSFALNRIGDFVLNSGHKEMLLVEKMEDASLHQTRLKNEDTTTTCGILGGIFPALKYLNLHQCFIRSFQTIVNLSLTCPNLEELCIAQNQLSDISNYSQLPTHLNPNPTLSQDNIHSLPQDEEEDDDNDQEKASSWDPFLPSNLFVHVKRLDLTHCYLYSWTRHIRMLRFLPSLEILVLNDNPIRHIVTITPIETDANKDMALNEPIHTNETFVPTNTAMTTTQINPTNLEFATLKELHLGGTLLDSWTSINALASFLQLKILRLSSTPITNSIGTGEARMNIIARLPNLEQLNLSNVTPKERVEAERRYVSSIARELLQLNHDSSVSSSLLSLVSFSRNTTVSTTEGFTTVDEIHRKRQQYLVQHPRFEELFQKHKDSMTSSSTNYNTMVTNGITEGDTLAHHVLHVTIRSMATGSITSEPQQKRLPSNLRVGRLKVLCSRAFGLDADLQRLHFRSEGDPFPTELDDDENTLAYYGVTDGCEILMNEIDLEAKRREKLNEVELQNTRIDKQERSVTVMQNVQKQNDRTCTK